MIVISPGIFEQRSKQTHDIIRLPSDNKLQIFRNTQQNTSKNVYITLGRHRKPGMFGDTLLK